MKDYTWFFRGVQSAIFLYASCGPCYGYRDQKKRRKEAKRSQAEKQALRDADPIANHQPAPFEINPFWLEEIELGPGPPARRVKKQKQKQRQTATATVQPGQSEPQDLERGDSGILESGKHSSHGKRLEAKMGEYKDRLKTLDPAHIKETWHNRRQRRDEEYIDSEDDTDDDSGAHFHLRRPSQVARMKYNKRHYMTRAPPVNDLHPPVVCTPSPHVAERKWMKEKPPSAAFMAGKEGARANPPSRTVSRASNPRTRAVSAASTFKSSPRQRASRPTGDSIRTTNIPGVSLTEASPDSVPVLSDPRFWRRSARHSRTGSVSEDDDDGSITIEHGRRDLDILRTSNALGKPSNRKKASRGALGKVLASRDLNGLPSVSAPTSPRLSATQPTGRGIQSARENISPALTGRSGASSPPGSPAASPIPFQARTHSTSITSAPVSPFLGPQLDDPRSDSKLDQSGPILTVRDPSIDILQALVSPSSLLHSRLSRESDPTKIRLPALDLDAPQDGHAGEFDEDDGWLWTETGERKWRTEHESRNLKNRWSIDF